MDLPQELLDEIISYIPPDDYKLLRSCSLVAKSWVHPSRTRIFDHVDVSGTVFLGSWLKNISPTSSGMLLQHVRSLSCYIADIPDSYLGPVDFLHDYSSSLRRLEHLALDSGRPLSLARTETYSAFQHTLSYLHVRSFSVTTNVVVTLVNYFPNLAHLHLKRLSHKVDDQPIPPLSRPLQELTVAEFASDGLPLIDQLMKLHPQCEKITVAETWRLRQVLAQRIINGVEASIKRLNLKSDLEGVSNFPKIL